MLRDEKMTQTQEKIRKNYGSTQLILGNGAIVLWIILGTLTVALFVPLASLIFFASAAFLVFFELGKHGCVSCFLCKNCTIGMGKLPDLFFKREGTFNVNRRALRLFPFVYLLLTALPIALIAVSLFMQVTVFETVLLAGVLAFSVYSGVARRETLTGAKNKQPQISN